MSRDGTDGLGLYLRVSRLPWPKSFYLKVLAICFLGMHLPLIVSVVGMLTLLKFPSDVFVPLLVLLVLATLVATGVTLFLVRKMLAPMRAVGHALSSYRRFGIIRELPETGGDEAGALMRNVNKTLHAVDDLRANLENLSFIDPLTGLGNRRWLMLRAEEAFAERRRRGGWAVMAIVDVDRLKQINDGYGHAEGDVALKKVAQALRMKSRASDLVARIGGDEFCVLMFDLPLDRANDWVTEVRQGLATETAADGRPLSFSAGLTDHLGNSEEFADMFARADQALYAAKSAGRNTVQTVPAAGAGS